MTRLTLSTASPLTAKADALVVAALQGADGPVADDAAFAPAVQAAALAGATGKPGSVTTIPGAGFVTADRIVVVGIGKAAGRPVDGGRRTPSCTSASARPPARRPVRVAGHSKVISTLSAIDITAAAEGHLLGAYVFDTLQEAGDRRPSTRSC